MSNGLVKGKVWGVADCDALRTMIDGKAVLGIAKEKRSQSERFDSDES